MSMTAKVKLGYMQQPGGGGEGTTTLRYDPDYNDAGRNAEWAAATPALNLTMTVKDEVVERQGLEVGDCFTLTFEKEG